MQKYQSIISGTNGSVIRNVPVTVLKEDGSLAEIFLDREGRVPASNPLATDSRGVFYFYAVNGRYSLRTSVDGITITDADAVLLNDPEEIATAGPIAEAVAAAQAAAQQAQNAVEGSGIPELVAAAQNAVVDANNAVVQAQAAASLADTAKNESAAAKVAAENAQSGAQSASAQAGQARADAQTAAQAAAQSAASIDLAYLLNRANHTGTQSPDTIAGLTQWQANPTGVKSINGGQLAGMRNKIINGKMEIGQRGTSFPSALGLTYTLDRWIYVLAGVVPYGALTISQQSDAPSNAVSRDSLRVTVTTADTTIASGVLHQVKQVIEGYNVRDLIGRAFTLSFWVRSSKTGIHCVDFRNQVGMVDRSYIAEYTVNAADTWEKKAVTVPNGLITEGAWNWTNGAGLQVGFILASGTNFHGVAGEWQVGNLNATANQVNCLDTVGNIFAITDVQLEAGEVATPFEHRPYGIELALCLRYFQAVAIYARMAVYEPGLAVSCFSSFPNMRVTPTVTLRAITYQNCTGVELQTITPSAIAFAAAAVSAGDAYFVSTQDVLLSAEL